MSAIDEGVEEEGEDGTEESEKHDRASWEVGSSRSAGIGCVLPQPAVRRALDGITGAVLVALGMRFATEHR